MFNSEEFLKTREPSEQLFYKNVSTDLMMFLETHHALQSLLRAYLPINMLQVLETHIFHSFLKDRLNRKMDSFARMELSTRSETQK